MAAVVNPACPFSGRPVEPHCLTTWKGQVVGFCNPACRDKFAGDPERFIAQIPGLKR